MSSFGNIILTSSAHLVRMMLGLLLIKLISYYAGPEGLGRLGQFISFASILALMAGGGVTNGVIKYVAEFNGNDNKLKSFINEAATFSLFCSIVILISCCLTSKILASYIFGDTNLYWVFVIIGIAQCGYAVTSLVNAIVSGLRQTHKFAFIQITGSLLAVPIVYLLVRYGGLPGASLAIISAAFLSLIPALYVYKLSEIRITFLPHKIRTLSFGRLPHYSLMLITSVIAFPLVEIIIRQWLIEHAGYLDAGLWQGSIKLSAAYLGFFSVFLAYVFLPVISDQSRKDIIFKLVVKYMSVIAVLFIGGGSILYVWRYFFISFLFSESFNGLGEVIVYQLIGDFFKICAYVIGFVGVAKGATALYIGAECIQSILFIACVYLFGNSDKGLITVMESYAITYGIYFLVCCIALSIYLLKNPKINAEGMRK
ncbi:MULTISPECIES: O-antigen translocase [unclassified Pseudomonas]|uniref:O-antigen translocase n=1 Tax=unclassified Pseudomonas TaxID=196821 RepID=UPI00385D36C4